MNLIKQAQIIKFHNDRSLEFSDDHKKLGWKNADSQLSRFNALSRAFKLDHASLLDVGCGYADFKTYLDRQFTGVSYTGIDIVHEFVIEAARRFANDRFTSFIYGDFATTDLTEVDFVFSCGALSYRDNDADIHFTMIKKMWDMSRKGVAFCLLDKSAFPKHPLLIGHDKDEVFDFCLSLTKRATLTDGYLPDDFMISMSK